MDVKHTRQTNLQRLLDEAGSLKKFSEKVGLSPGYLSNLRHKTAFGDKAARALEERAKLPSGALDAPIHGEAPAAPDLIAAESFKAYEVSRMARLLPRYDFESVVKQRAKVAPTGYFPEVPEARGAEFVVAMEGFAMATDPSMRFGFPVILPGTILYIDPLAAIKPGDIVLAHERSATTAIIRFVTEEGGKRYLGAINPAIPYLDASKANIIGKVVWKVVSGPVTA